MEIQKNSERDSLAGNPLKHI